MIKEIIYKLNIYILQKRCNEILDYRDLPELIIMEIVNL